MKTIIFTFLFASMAIGSSAASAEPTQVDECTIRAMSNAERYECLAHKLKSLEIELRNDITGIVQNLPKSGLWEFDDPKAAIGFYERRGEAIESANTKWKKFAVAECQVVSGVYEGGSGEDTYAIECLIGKTVDRLSYLKSREPYKSFRKN
jgi:uncharacterized protein YecT (DUF1311 family)